MENEAPYIPSSKNKTGNKFIITIASLLVIIIVASPYTNMFGKYYKTSNDYTCCKDGQLYTFHYYADYFFWVKVKTGFTKEKIGKPTPGGCNIECPVVN